MKHHVKLHQQQMVHSNAGKQQFLQKVKNGVVENIVEVQMKLKQKISHQVHLVDGDHPKSHHDQIYQILKFTRHAFLHAMIATAQLLSSQSVLTVIGWMVRNLVLVPNGNNVLTSHTGQSVMVTGNVKITEVLDDVPSNVMTIILFNQLFQLFHHQIQVLVVLHTNLF